MTILKNGKKKSIAESRSNAMLLIIAFICAIASWFIIAMTKYPAESKTISNIPVKIDINGTSAAENDLTVISPSTEQYVRVNIDCSRTDFNRITADTIEAYVELDGITTSGTRPLTVKVKSTNGAELSSYEVTPSIIKVELDKTETRTFALSAKIPNIKPAEGRTFGDEIVCDPAEITIKGPKKKLDLIAECYAISDKEESLDHSYTLTSDRFELWTEDGKEIDQKNITFEPTVASLSIDVLRYKTVKIVPKIISVPDGFDTSCISYTVTPDTIPIAYHNNDTELNDDLELIKIPLSDLDIGYSKDFDISNQLSSKGVTNLTGINTVNVTLNDEGLISREMLLGSNNIHLLDAPSDGYDYSIITEQLSIKVIGPADIVNELTAADLDAEVSLLNADSTIKMMDQFVYDAKISCPSHNNVWSVTNAKVNIKKTLKDGATTSTNYSSVTTTTRAN